MALIDKSWRDLWHGDELCVLLSDAQAEVERLRADLKERDYEVKQSARTLRLAQAEVERLRPYEANAEALAQDLVAADNRLTALTAVLEFYADEQNWVFDEARDCQCGGPRRECRCPAPANDDGTKARAVLDAGFFHVKDCACKDCVVGDEASV